MKNMQSSTPGFVLTSMSFKVSDNKKNKQVSQQSFDHAHRSSIAKFDYCLPPEEGSNLHDAGFNYHSL